MTRHYLHEVHRWSCRKVALNSSERYCSLKLPAVSTKNCLCFKTSSFNVSNVLAYIESHYLCLLHISRGQYSTPLKQILKRIFFINLWQLCVNICSKLDGWSANSMLQNSKFEGNASSLLTSYNLLTHKWRESLKSEIWPILNLSVRKFATVS